MAEELLTFNDVLFKIKEFESADTLKGCYLAFYLPKERHLETKQGKEDTAIKKKGSKKKIFLVDSNNQRIKKIDIDKTQSQNYIKEKNEEKEERISKLGLNADNIDSEFDALGDEATPKNKLTRNKYEDYDVFYDVYTNQDNIKNYIEKFEVEDGVAKVEASFLQDFFKKSREGKENHKWCFIPRLIPKNETMDKFEFDPVPLEDKGFVVTDFHNTKEKALTFQRRIANVKKPSLTLQSPKEFKAMLNGEESAKHDKEEQAEKIEKSAKYILKEIDSYNISEGTKELRKNKWEKKLKNLKENPQKILGKTIGDTGEYCVASLLFEKKSTRHLSNQRKLDANFNTNGFNHTIPDFLVTLNGYPALVEVKNVQTQSLTEQISFELKLAREYELDYLFVCNDYTKLTENIAGEVLSKKEHKELVKNEKATQEFDKETKTSIKQKQIEIVKKDKQDRDWSQIGDLKTSRLRSFSEAGGDRDARSGFIDHRHLHRSIKTAFKEIYLHHIKGAAPNKIIIKRLDLNDATQIEEELNKDQNIQQCGE